MSVPQTKAELLSAIDKNNKNQKLIKATSRQKR